MQQILFVIGILGIVLFVACAAAAAIVFFRMDIRGVYADYTGKKRQREIEKAQASPSGGRSKSRRSRGKGGIRGKQALVGVPEQSEPEDGVRQVELEPALSSTNLTSVSGDSLVVDEEDAATSTLDEVQDLHEKNDSSDEGLDEEDASTNLLDEEDASTTLLDGEESTPEIDDHAAPNEASDTVHAPVPEEPQQTVFTIIRTEMDFSAKSVIDSAGQEVAIMRKDAAADGKSAG